MFLFVPWSVAAVLFPLSLFLLIHVRAHSTISARGAPSSSQLIEVGVTGGVSMLYFQTVTTSPLVQSEVSMIYELLLGLHQGLNQGK